MWCNVLFVFLTFFVCNVPIAQATGASEIVQLSGEPGYRSVELRWQTIKNDAKGASNATVRGYSVHYCELQSWGLLRCKDRQKIILPTSHAVDELGNTIVDEKSAEYDSDDLMYKMRIGGLRMATTYSFHVKPLREGQTNRTDRADDSDGNSIIIPTKGFSARATQCLPQASVVEVSTGPHFGGRISVEPTEDAEHAATASNEASCSVQGDPASPGEVYVLRIDHARCGSRVNETTVATFIIVQENLPILTHSTRRFLVLCTFQPEVLTVRAGMNLPPRHPGLGSAVSSRQNNARSLLGNGRAQLVLKSDYDDYTEIAPDGNTIAKRNHKGSKSLERQIEPESVHAARLVDAIPTVDEIQPKDVRNNSSLSVVLTLVAVGACVGCVAVIVTIRWKGRKEEDVLELPVTNVMTNSLTINNDETIDEMSQT